MSNTLAEYESKQAELKTLGKKLEADWTTEIKQHLAAVIEYYGRICGITDYFDIKELPEWNSFLDNFHLKRKSVTQIMRENAMPDAKKRKEIKVKSAKGKVVFKLSDEKSKVILDFIGKGEKSTQEIADKLETKNASNALTYLKKQGKIVVARKDGLKKFWKRA